MLAGGGEPIQLWGMPDIELDALPEIMRRSQVGHGGFFALGGNSGPPERGGMPPLEGPCSCVDIEASPRASISITAARSDPRCQD